MQHFNYENGPFYTILIWDERTAPYRIMNSRSKQAAKNAVRRVRRVSGMRRVALTVYDFDWVAGSEPQTLIDWKW